MDERIYYAGMVILVLSLPFIWYFMANVDKGRLAGRQLFKYDRAGKATESPLGKPLRHVTSVWGEPEMSFENYTTTYHCWSFITYYRSFFKDTYFYVFGYDKVTRLCTSAPGRMFSKPALDRFRSEVKNEY